MRGVAKSLSDTGELGRVQKSLEGVNLTFYVADALSGQDGVRSAGTFHTEDNPNFLAISKFDSDSKGGVALGIAHQLQIPLRFIGHGEKIPDFV
ncbi:P-loop NTPase family protein [Helicobacter suis]|nr:hypothetical protein HSHS1_01400 [Helicobacter suis HS1]